MKDGIYFNMPDNEYHAIEALSASGIKNILVSPMDFWARSWMAPDFLKEESTEACKIGRAYHKRILEGQEAFLSEYTEMFEAPDNCLKTKDDLAQALEEAGVQFKKSAAKPELIRLAAENGIGPIFDILKEQYDISTNGKEQLGFNLLARIEIAASMIEKHPQIHKCFSGGFPEVSIVWTEDGIKMKSRIDYIKPKAFIDLKTFANMGGKSIDRAVYSAMASGRYHIQVTFYKRAVLASKTLDVFCKDESAVRPFMDAFVKEPNVDCFLVFQQKGPAPLARAFKFSQDAASGMVGAAEASIDQGIRIYKECLEKFGTGPWIDTAPIEELYDAQFPIWATDL